MSETPLTPVLDPRGKCMKKKHNNPGVSCGITLRAGVQATVSNRQVMGYYTPTRCQAGNCYSESSITHAERGVPTSPSTYVEYPAPVSPTSRPEPDAKVPGRIVPCNRTAFTKWPRRAENQSFGNKDRLAGLLAPQPRGTWRPCR